VQSSSTALPPGLVLIQFFIFLTKNAFENEWKARTVLPAPSRTSPPPTSAQKVHGQLANQQPQPVVPPVALAPPVNSASQQSLTLTGTPSTTTPAAVDPPAPQQQTSASNQQQQPSSPPRMSSPDMDMDVGGTPEPESMGADDMARDGESDLVVQQLERGLPRWENLGDFGWWKEKEGSEDRRLELVLAIKGHKDAVYVSSLLSVLTLPVLILMSLQWQSLCNRARGHA
jgi:chromatin structure-remodeling complex subunit RSC1/2